jgi:hypothetical protein
MPFGGGEVAVALALIVVAVVPFSDRRGAGR